jgi:hypothetical protein
MVKLEGPFGEIATMRQRILSSCLAGLAILGAPAAQACIEPRDLLAARYQPAAIRAASGVATTAEARAPLTPGAIVFRPDLAWHDGRTCKDWVMEPSSRAMVEVPDPNLSDAEIGPVNGPDHRLNASYVLACRDALNSWEAPFRMIDRTILVTPNANGGNWLVFAVPPSTAELIRFQDQLRDMKFLNAPSTGAFDTATRTAAARYAKYRGAGFRFDPPVLSKNLMDLRPPAGGVIADVESAATVSAPAGCRPLL